MAPGVLLEPYMSQGGQGVAGTPIVSKGLKIRKLFLQISVNEASAQLCWHRPGLLTRREELFPLARDVVRASGYQYAKGHSRLVPTLELLLV